MSSEPLVRPSRSCVRQGPIINEEFDHVRSSTRHRGLMND